jgi:peptidoglycan/LPS O-acetylase OafA/YrhL
LLLREREREGKVSVKQFYIRRILRIWPLYYLALALGLVVAFLPHGDPSDPRMIGWFAIYMGAWYYALHGFPYNPVGPLWSISVEEQFYLFAPWTVKYLSRRSLYEFCAVLIAVSNGWLYYFGKVSAENYRIWANSFVEFEYFAFGILLCLVLRGRVPTLAIWMRIAGIAAGWFCWFYAGFGLHGYFGLHETPGSWTLIGIYALPALGSVLIIFALLGTNPKLLPGWAVYLGRISFGLYAYHEFAILITNRVLIGHLASITSPIALLKIGIELGLTMLMAALSYRFYETPFLKLKKRHTVIESQPIESAGTSS